MPELRTSKQRRMKSKTANQNNKDVLNYDRNKPEPPESKTHTHQSTSGDETMDVNGNLHLDSLPTHEEGTSVTRNEVPSTKSIESENQGDIVTNSIKSNLKNRSDYYLTSLQSTALEVREHKGIGNDAPCGPNRNAPSKLNSSDTSKTTLPNDFNRMASQELEVAILNQRNLSVTGQTPSGFRSNCQRKPTNLQNPDGNIMQRDFNKRQGISVHYKTGFNKKRHISSEAQSFPAAPFVNIPASHSFHPNTFLYGSHNPQLNLTEHQRLPIWNFGWDQHSPLPLPQLSGGVYQAGKQLKDKNYGNAFKEKYSRNSNQDHPGKTNRFQNRFKSRNYSSPECSGINNPVYKNMTQFEKDGQHSKPGSATYLPDVRSKGAAGNHGYSDNTGALLTESVKHKLASSKYGEKSGKQIRYFENGEIQSQMEQNGVADMKHQFVKAFQVGSNNGDTLTRIASQIVQPQTPSDVCTPREYPNTRRHTQTDNPCGVQDCRSTCIGKTQTGWCHPESCDAETKHMSSCNVLEQPNATRNHPGHTRENVPCEKVSNGNIDISARTNTYTHFQTLPPHFDPTVHPLQVFQKAQGMDYNHRQLIQRTEKPFSECTPPSSFIPQNANVSDGCSNSAEYKLINYANEHQVPLNVVASSMVNANSRRSTTYSGSNSYTSTDSISTMNPSHVKDTADASNTSNGTNSLNPGSMTFSSTINEEIEEEMRRAQRMSIPVKHGSERCPPPHSHLNPNANEFSPTLTDCNGNQFTMTKQHGVCYFKRDLETSFVTHQESNTSYEHEVAEVLVSTSDNDLKTYYNDNHVLHKDGGSPFFPTSSCAVPAGVGVHVSPQIFPTYHQQTECYGSDHPLFDYCAARSDASFNTSHVVYNTGQQLSSYNPKHSHEPTLSSNQMQPADNYFVSNNNYFNETCAQFFTPVQSQANHSQVLPSSEVQIHPQSPYTNPGFTCSFVPMYITPSSAATPPMTFSGTEYCPVLMQNPVAQSVPFTVSLPAHMSNQTQPSHYSAPEQVSMTCSAHNYSFQAPVFNLQAYFEATQNNPTADHNTPNRAVPNTDLPDITQSIGYYEDNREIREQNLHSGTTQNENTDSTVHAETSHMQLNIADTSATSNIHNANSQVNSTDFACDNTTVAVSNVHFDQESATNCQNATEFDACKTLLLRLGDPGITLEKCRQNIAFESEKHYIGKWLELALRVIERNANKKTIDEMVSIMMSSQRKIICIDES